MVRLGQDSLPNIAISISVAAKTRRNYVHCFTRTLATVRSISSMPMSLKLAFEKIVLTKRFRGKKCLSLASIRLRRNINISFFVNCNGKVHLV